MVNNNFDYIRENINDVLFNIEKACKKVNKKTSDIELIAVTKTVPYDIVNFCINNGITSIGENRVQEFLLKYDKYYTINKKIHFIGHLQSNKVKYIIDKVDMIQSVDSLGLVSEINKQAIKHNKIMDIMIQVNISKDEGKFGVLEEELDDFLEKTREYSNVFVKGLMCIPKKYNDIDSIKVDFNRMHKLYIDKTAKKVDNINIMFLSMGMSNDYVDAILCGANVIRIGSNLFNNRK